MTRSLALLIIGLVFGGAIGFVVAAANGVTLDGHDHLTDHAPVATSQDHAAHDHGQMLILEPGPGAPTLEIAALPDPVDGWNLNIKTTGFRFAAERAGLDHVPGEGHAHVYVNGVKLGRVYANWVHLDALPPGDVEVEVTLNANDHRALAVGAVPLAATLMLDGP